MERHEGYITLGPKGTKCMVMVAIVAIAVQTDAIWIVPVIWDVWMQAVGWVLWIVFGMIVGW